MIRSIEIKNFKSIKSKLFPLRNLNILLGLNGMGKSSFIQSLLSLRQSRSLYNGRLDLNSSEYINLGTTTDALYQYRKKEDLSFNLKFDNEKTLSLQFEYKPEADYLLAKEFDRNLYNEPQEDNVFNQSLFKNNFQYLNANRIPPTSAHSKSFSYVVNDKNIGIFGEYTAHFIEFYHDHDIEFENLLHKNSWVVDSVTNEKFVNKTLLNQINLWMGEISPGVNIRTTSISSDFVLLEYTFKQPNYGTTNRFKPENVGFGISYSLPVVVALLSARPGELLIIENPESHIHPRGQAELGKLIALAAMNDVQIIVETHSDHVLNGIRVAIKENDITNDKVIVFYFEKVIAPTEQYSKITNIEINENGELSEYPPHMLDEWSNQLLKLL
jgi:predicted ATPase